MKDSFVNRFSFSEYEYEYLDDCVLIYLLKNDTILSLNITATFIWEQLALYINAEKPIDEESISKELIDHFRIDDLKYKHERIKKDVDRIIKEFILLGLLIDNHDRFQTDN